MFKKEVYIKRREKLRETVGSGLILLPGNDESPMNYADNPFHFHQDSSFKYFFGLDFPFLAGILDCETGEDIIFGDDLTVIDFVWMGPQPTILERASAYGIKRSEPLQKLVEILQENRSKGRTIHFLPPYRPENKIKLFEWLGITPAESHKESSPELVRAVIAQRNYKAPWEIEELRKAADISVDMHRTAMRMAAPGVTEAEITAAVNYEAEKVGARISFPIIGTINGQTLHNHYHGNTLKSGQMFLLDAGAEIESGYAADLSSTVPVDPHFTQVQRDIYNLTLDSHNTSIDMLKPGIAFKEVYLESARVIVRGLKDMGIMKGDVDDAVTNGAHALFFPCGLGHMMGMDVHDMEDLGEIYVGWDGKERPKQFGIKSLRLGRKLEPGFVLTIEPGIYFIPELIDKWQKEGTNKDFLNFDKINQYRDFGGIRNEEDFLITETGYELLGKPKPKSIEDVEAEHAKDLPL
ncbi:MAG: aminopeptidase P family protein [Bacteroidales bacterium]|nr:aminopeptidase P family protein [Bacteroidales bacterium]